MKFNAYCAFGKDTENQIARCRVSTYQCALGKTNTQYLSFFVNDFASLKPKM